MLSELELAKKEITHLNKQLYVQYKNNVELRKQIEYLKVIKTEATVALKEAELRGRLEKDKIGAVKSVFQNRLKDTEKIDYREERLKALIRLHKELDI